MILDGEADCVPAIRWNYLLENQPSWEPRTEDFSRGRWPSGVFSDAESLRKM